MSSPGSNGSGVPTRSRLHPFPTPTAGAFARLFFGSSDEARVDGQGRITIPQRLREAVGITKDVVVLGVRDRMEIWDRRDARPL